MVQGVGFRPFIYSLAREHGLTGFVLNHSSGVRIEVEGPPAAIERFQSDIRLRRPPLSVIESLDAGDIDVTHDEAFVILESESKPSASTPVSPDIAICDDCLREYRTRRPPLWLSVYQLHELWGHAHHHSRFAVRPAGDHHGLVSDVPALRSRISRSAQPAFSRATECLRGLRTACVAHHVNRQRIFEEQAQSTGPASIAAVKAMLASGAVVAIKGIGGFHLACDATNDAALRLLRERKSRIEQPFALMARDLAAVSRFAEVSGEEARLLSSRARPIVLLRNRKPNSISSLVAPRNEHLGVMLPYAPLHYLLLEEAPLVMTSANVSGEPIVRENAEARIRLHGIADALLVHNREIEVVCDDSVVRTLEDKEIPLRRSRGYAPFPVVLRQPTDDLLAVGAELKATLCITKGRFAYLSQHIGDMGTLETQRAFEAALSHMLRLFRVDPRCVVCDQHPGYLSTRWAIDFAKERGIKRFEVQHHHAHAAALAAENGLEPNESVIAVAFDGTGYGSDGAIWGASFWLPAKRRSGVSRISAMFRCRAAMLPSNIPHARRLATYGKPGWSGIVNSRRWRSFQKPTCVFCGANSRGISTACPPVPWVGFSTQCQH